MTVTGTNFTGATAVHFGTSPGTSVVVVSATEITVHSPSHIGAGTVNVTVITPGGTSVTSPADQFTYEPAPTVTTISPTSGPASGGTPVTITGTNFTGATTADFGGVAGTGLVVVDADHITVDSPPRSAGAHNVTVTTPSGTSGGDAQLHLRRCSDGHVHLAHGRAVTGGTTVTITGTNWPGRPR